MTRKLGRVGTYQLLGILNNMETKIYLKVTQSEGCFSNEFAIASQLFDGEEFSCFVPKPYIKILNSTDEDTYNALLQVRVITEENDLVLISLPTMEVYYNSFLNGTLYTLTQTKHIFP